MWYRSMWVYTLNIGVMVCGIMLNGQYDASAQRGDPCALPLISVPLQSNAVGWLSQSVTDTFKGWQEQVVALVDSFARWVYSPRGTYFSGSHYFGRCRCSQKGILWQLHLCRHSCVSLARCLLPKALPWPARWFAHKGLVCLMRPTLFAERFLGDVYDRLDLCAAPSCNKFCVGCGSYWPRRVFRPPGVFLGKRHQNTRRSPKGFGLGFGLGSGLGLGWSGSTCKVEIDDTRPAHLVAARSGGRIR